MQEPTIIVIADYGTGDPAFTEVFLQLKSHIPHATIFPHSTPSFSTINTGFWIAQIALTPHLKNTYIFSNTAPRKHEKKAQISNSGEALLYAKLTNGFEIIAVNAGYNFSFVKPFIQDLYNVRTQNKGSQFRSRDFYPHAVAKLVLKDSSFLEQRVDISTLPDYPFPVIASIDGYGNIKTTLRASQLSYAPGQKLLVTIAGDIHEATFSDGVFNVEEGTLVCAPGSSGHQDPFIELFVRGASARNLFQNPLVESPITLVSA